MKINEIIKEEIDQREADKVYQSLIATNSPMARLTAYYFQQTRNSARHTSIDSAQQEAEILAKAALDKIDQSKQQGYEPLNKIDTEKYKTYSDKFYGNQYVKIGRAQLPSELQAYLPVLDKGLGKAASSGFQAGKNISKLFDPSDIQRKRPKTV